MRSIHELRQQLQQRRALHAYPKPFNSAWRLYGDDSKTAGVWAAHEPLYYRAWLEDDCDSGPPWEQMDTFAEPIELFRRYLSEQWSYVGVVVALMRDDEDGEPVEIDRTALWGIESDSHEYHVEVANDLAYELHSQYAKANRFALSNTLHTEAA